MIRIGKWFLVAFALALPFGGCLAQAQQPDGRGEVVTQEPTYDGTQANAPIPPEMHQRNRGGSDGAGLCVIASLVTNLRYQGCPEEDVQRLWEMACERPGGYYPEKLETLLREWMPTGPWSKWVSYYGKDPAILDELSANGLPIGATMSWGKGYPGTIHHMISLIHHQTGKLACVVDNNDPGVYHWMPATEEFDARWPDGGNGWAVAFSQLPLIAQVSLVVLAAAVVLMAASLVLTWATHSLSAVPL